MSGPAEPSPRWPWPADRVEHWPIDTLIHYANNPGFTAKPTSKGAADARHHVVDRRVACVSKGWPASLCATAIAATRRRSVECVNSDPNPRGVKREKPGI
jgi:hypothetical protein